MQGNLFISIFYLFIFWFYWYILFIYLFTYLFVCVSFLGNLSSKKCTTIFKLRRTGKNRYFLFYPENKFWFVMQIVSLGDNPHEKTNLNFWEKKKHILKWLPLIFPPRAKRQEQANISVLKTGSYRICEKCRLRSASAEARLIRAFVLNNYIIIVYSTIFIQQAQLAVIVSKIFSFRIDPIQRGAKIFWQICLP